MKYLEIHENFLKKHETTPRKELAKLFNAKFKTHIPYKALAQKCTKIGLVCPNIGCFQKGNISHNKGTKGLMKRNKTSFKKGNKPVNIKKVGTISVRKDKNGRLYMYIKIAEPNKWQMFHVYIWEYKYGKIPKGHCVIFRDKNTSNTSLDNLILISKAELVKLNQKYSTIDKSLKETALQVIRLSSVVNKKTKQGE